MISEIASSHSLYSIKKNSSHAERPCKDYHLLSHFKAHQEESDSKDPAAKSMTRKETGNEVGLQSSPGGYFLFSKSSLYYICILGHQKNVGHTLTV